MLEEWGKEIVTRYHEISCWIFNVYNNCLRNNNQSVRLKIWLWIQTGPEIKNGYAAEGQQKITALRSPLFCKSAHCCRSLSGCTVSAGIKIILHCVWITVYSQIFLFSHKKKNLHLPKAPMFCITIYLLTNIVIGYSYMRYGPSLLVLVAAYSLRNSVLNVCSCVFVYFIAYLRLISVYLPS
jgi:hypothetical protein